MLEHSSTAGQQRAAPNRPAPSSGGHRWSSASKMRLSVMRPNCACESSEPPIYRAVIMRSGVCHAAPAAPAHQRSAQAVDPNPRPGSAPHPCRRQVFECLPSSGIVTDCTRTGYLVCTGTYQYVPGTYQYIPGIMVQTGTYQYVLSMYQNNVM